MTPDDSSLLLHAYLDGELDPANALAIERRLATDPAFAAEYDRIASLQTLLRERLQSEALPADLRSRIEASTGTNARYSPSWRALAASVAVTALVASGATWLSLQPDVQNKTGDAIITAHIRSLMAPQPVDVVSSDQHTVKPWFNGQIPEAPRVADLTKQDFPLVGGRLDVVDRIPVPTLVYRHRKHLISLTALPKADTQTSPPASSKADGYNIVRWTDNGVDYWAVSDLGAGDLGNFVRLFRFTMQE